MKWRADHPEDCPPECPDCAQQEAWDAMRDELDCDDPDEVETVTLRTGYVACGRCDRCLDS